MEAALLRERPDALLHLGDGAGDLPRDCPGTAVRGNCDLASSAADKITLDLGGVKAFITHGHLYRVKYSVDSLVYAAMEAGASLALYGHTHIPNLCFRIFAEDTDRFQVSNGFPKGLRSKAVFLDLILCVAEAGFPYGLLGKRQ